LPSDWGIRSRSSTTHTEKKNDKAPDPKVPSAGFYITFPALVPGLLRESDETELMTVARPTKWRRIEHIPAIPYFIPSQKDVDALPENRLKLEELEAIRLKDLEGLEQSECAEKMEISRPTFQRILLSAREKIADSLVNGKVIRIEGGNFTLHICPVKCFDCSKEWTESYENLASIKSGEYACPACGSNKVGCIQTCKAKFCKGNCRRQGRRGE
jgi:predicted DNA-binding protein (UPF0251 family)/DNA-directed RNA polymerase subunit RPC12/RpoP